MPFYSSFFFVFVVGRLISPCNFRPSQQSLLIWRVVKRCLMQPSDLARAKYLPAALSRVWSRAAWACRILPAPILAFPGSKPAGAQDHQPLSCTCLAQSLTYHSLGRLAHQSSAVHHPSSGVPSFTTALTPRREQLIHLDLLSFQGGRSAFGERSFY